MPITVRDIQEARALAKAKEKRVYVWDAMLKGFGCRVSPNGHAAWFVKTRMGRNGHQKFHTFDYEPRLKTQAAYAKARELLLNIHVNLVDPMEERRKAQAQQTINLSGKLEDAISAFLTDKLQNRSERYRTETEQMFQREVIANLDGNRLLANISRDEYQSLIDTKNGVSQASARALLAALRPFLKWCYKRGKISEPHHENLDGPGTLPERERELTSAELKLIWNATASLAEPYQSFYRMLMLTAQRRDEVAGMLWSEINLEKAIWVIPGVRTKNGKEHTVHLSPQALAILNGVTRIDGCDVVFPSESKTAITGFSKAKSTLDGLLPPEMRISGKNAWRVHDLRRTAATGIGNLGFPPFIIDRVLNHVPKKLERTYQKQQYLDERKRALCAWGSCIDRLVSEHQSSNVVSILRT